MRLAFKGTHALGVQLRKTHVHRIQQTLCAVTTVRMDSSSKLKLSPLQYSSNSIDVFPGREHRGVWIASVTNIDWPRSPTSSVATQQEELRHLVDRIAEAGLNAIYFQVRPAGDAFYQSDIEPWSVYLTGRCTLQRVSYDDDY